VLVDGAQSTVHLDIDVQDMDCDFFACSSHKVYGPTGVGVLYGKRELLEAMPPFQGGGEMIKEVSFGNITYNDLPYKFEAGTPNIGDTVAFKAAIDFVNSIGKDVIARHEEDLMNYATEALQGIDGLRIIGQAAHKVSVVSFIVEGVHPQDIGILLDNRGIAVRTGNHCAQPCMAHFCIPGTTRASIAMYNTKEEIDRLVVGVEKAVIPEIEAEIVDEFSLFDSWDEKYEYIIDLGKRLPPLEDQYKLDENKVRGCQSTVYLVADHKDGRVYFRADSDAVIVKGLISMLIRVLSGHTPDEIIGAPLNFINQIGMTSHLAQTRSNGLLAMVKQMKNYALAYKLKSNAA
jgi:sulfur transfer protein SufE